MKKLRCMEDLILNGDVTDEDENRQRAHLLGEYRGYPDREIFENVPQDISWRLCRLEAGDTDRLRYLDYSYWNELSNSTSLPAEGAKSVLSGRTVYGVSNDGYWNALQALHSGAVFPPLILLTGDEEKYLILEGHLRATVYAMKPGSENGAAAFVGVCGRDALVRKNAVMM